MNHENAMSRDEKEKYLNPTDNIIQSENILKDFDPDFNVSLQDKNKKHNKTTYGKEFFDFYMKRPISLSDLSAFEFHANYKIQRLGNRKNINTIFLLKMEINPELLSKDV